MFAFLSFLNRHDHAVRHGRWLPPRALKALNDHLVPPDNLGPGRSELQAARIPFVHYLAERAGLVGLIGGCLKPTPLALEWLAAPRAHRLRPLWDAWGERSDANRALWRRYRLPALEEDDDPVARFLALLEPLAACPVGPLSCPTDLLDALAERHPALLRPQATYAAWTALDPGERAAFEARARDVLIELLTRHLVWFGLLDWQIGKLANQQIGKSANGGGDGVSGGLCLTPLGAALLGREDGAWPPEPDPAPLVVAPFVDSAERTEDPAVLLHAPPGLPLPDRFALQAVVPPDPAPSPGGASVVEAGPSYRLTRPRFLRALQRGHTVGGVVTFFERASGQPLPAPVLGALYRWADAFDRVAIRQVILLQACDPDTLSDLAAQRHIRETLGDTLNARTVAVRADRLDALLRRLARRGILPRLELPSPPTPSPSTPSPSQGEGRGEGEAGEGRTDDGRPRRGRGGAGEGGRERESAAERAAVAVALRVYAHLADALGLPTRPAHALARRRIQDLPLPLRDAVERQVERTLDALHRAAPVDMEDRLPRPTGPLLESLEAAIDEQTTVEIEYYTAGRAHHTTRRVDPLRLEWHGDVVYLVAYCHLRGEQRVFRVDRIAHLKPET